MKYSVESLQKQFVIHRDELRCIKNSHMASEIEPLFNEDGSFNEDNWNSGMDEIRNRLNDIIIGGNHLSLNYYKDKDEDVSEEIIISSMIEFYSDQWYFIIDIISIDSNTYDSYVITWYKSRGCTEMITKNGNAITITEYIDILNLLDESGFFMKTNWLFH